MAEPPNIAAGPRRPLEAAFLPVRWIVLALAGAAGASFLVMMTITCLDVLLRAFKRPLPGALDMVEICGAVGLACALPYTTAVKGHVAIEYFFHKLSRRGRIAVDSVARLLGMGLFAVLAWESVRYGLALRQSGQVTPTLQMPVFWVPWVIAGCCAVVVLVILYNLLHPGKEMIKP